MPQDLPGFYFDPEKKKYFSIKGPIPGTVRKPVHPPQNPVSLPAKAPRKFKKDSRICKLLHYKELYGSFIDCSNWKGSFQEECKKKLASEPKIWKYQGVDKDADCSLALMCIDVQTPEGQCSSNSLITGGKNGCLSLFDVGNVGHYFNHGDVTTAEFVWPENDKLDSYPTTKDIWKFNGATLVLQSSVSSIRIPRQEYFGTNNGNSALQYALISTLGSELSGGALYILNLAEPVDLSSNMIALSRLRELASLDCTIWGMEISHSSRKAVLGTNRGATLVDLERGVPSVICRSKSDVLSVQLIQSGNVGLCGLRNGAIVTVDVRQQQRQLARYKIPYPSSDSERLAQKTTKQSFLLRGNIQPSCTVYMPSAICSLVSLEMYDQYFLASSMDGSIKLYDHRLTKRGPVQSYEGQVNSHTHLQLATDSNERFLMSGGEDCKVRVWSIKSGEMLFEEKLTSSAPVAVCWQGSADIVCKSPVLSESLSGQTRGWDAWLGSADGLLRMQFSL
ncbi:uncharacterized protein LOC130823152 isoform X2 [Amaranthus tricolor]|uniref:uncharacterized protein LOC130823152 isoform X2 n=1 Tax=Amaranthus tricolor TaxID=29722 RepID=UPI00258DB5BE|nr:uncharacterized protein LOC130823152 isoform X2 [Amaranthus tricolor]